MHSSDDFDPSIYMFSPRLDVPSQIALGRQLLAAAPAELPKQAEICKRTLRETIRILEEGYKTAQTEDSGADKRPVDYKTDNTWACLKSRLDPYTWLDEERFPETGRAKSIAQKLFPSGLSFTQLEYGAQWAEASWRMKFIDEEKLESELRRLCGDVFIDELFHWHKEYGKMVGVIPTRRDPKASGQPRPKLAELRRQAGQAVVAWQAQLVAMHLSGHPGARAALRPTDEYREKTATPPAAKEPSAPAPAPAPTPPAPPPA